MMKSKKLLFGILVVILSFTLLLTGFDQKTTTKGPIVLGVATHYASSEGEASVKAAEMAVEEINAAGGVEVGGIKRPLKLESIDTREAIPSMPITDALAATEKLIIEKKPVAIVNGGFRSEVMLADMDMITKYKIPFITCFAMTPEFEKKMRTDPVKYKYAFRAGYNVQGLVGLITNTFKFIGDEFKLKKLYFVYEDVLWAKGTAAALDNWAKANGYEVLGSDAYPTGSTDFSSTMSKAKAAGAQVLVPVFDMPQTINLIRQIKSMQVRVLIAGYISPATTANGWKTFNGEIEGLINYCYEFGALSSPKVPKSEAFQKNYAKKYGQAALDRMAAHGPGPAYDAVYIVADAIKRANSLNGDDLVAAMEKTDLQGVVGRIKFNNDHQLIYGTDPKETGVGMSFQWQAPGKRVIVYPPSIAEGKIQLPASLKK